jgi:WD40 repeat protein
MKNRICVAMAVCALIGCEYASQTRAPGSPSAEIEDTAARESQVESSQWRHRLARSYVDQAAARMEAGQWDAALHLLLEGYETAETGDLIRQSALNLLASWNAASPQVVRDARCVAVSPDGRSFIANLNETLVVFDTATCRPTGVSIPDAEFATYSPDGKLVLVSRMKGRLRLCETKSGETIRELGHWSGYHAPTVHFDLTTQRLIVAGIHPPRVYDLLRGTQIPGTPRVESWREGTKFVEIDPMVRLVAQEEGGIVLYDVQNGFKDAGGGAITLPELARLRLYETPLAAKFFPDGKRLVTIGDGGGVSVWDTTNYTRIAMYSLPYSERDYNLPTCLALSADGKIVAVGDRRGFVEFLNADDLSLLGAAAQHDFISQVQFGSKTSEGPTSPATLRGESRSVWSLSAAGELQCFSRLGGRNIPLFTARGALRRMEKF